MADLTKIQKKEWAKTLYLDQSVIYTQQEICERVGISRQSLSKWINGEKWNDLRVSMVTTKAQSLRRLYNQLDDIQKAIELREPGERHANSKEADTISKLTASIKNLEEEANIADKISVGVEFCNFVRKQDIDKAKEITRIYDQFIKTLI